MKSEIDTIEDDDNQYITGDVGEKSPLSQTSGISMSYSDENFVENDNHDIIMGPDVANDLLRTAGNENTGPIIFQLQPMLISENPDIRVELRIQESPKKNLRVHECKNCNYKSTTLQGLKQHMALHYAMKTLTCPICEKMLKTKQTLENHVNSHLGK